MLSWNLDAAKSSRRRSCRPHIIFQTLVAVSITILEMFIIRWPHGNDIIIEIRRPHNHRLTEKLKMKMFLCFTLREMECLQTNFMGKKERKKKRNRTRQKIWKQKFSKKITIAATAASWSCHNLYLLVATWRWRCSSKIFLLSHTSANIYFLLTSCTNACFVCW